MKTKIFFVIFILLFLTGCPPAMWIVKPDLDYTFSVNDVCVRNLQGNKGVVGIVQLDFDRTDDRFERYLIETEFGVANLELEYRSCGIPIVHLYLHGNGVEAPTNVKAGGKEFINNLVSELKSACGS